jgi:hypothetical protein
MTLLRILATALALACGGPALAQFSIDTVSYHGVSHATHRSNVNALPGQGYLLVSISVAGGWANSHYSAVWARQTGPAQVSSHGMSLAQYTSQRATWEGLGYRAKVVSASGSGSNARFGGFFVQRHDVRNATLAVIRDGRLVHARGFGYAEAGHPPSPPDALFRIGSISKSITAMLAHQLMQSGTGNFGLGTAYPTYMGLPYGNGGLGVTLQSMFHHTTGVAQPTPSEIEVAQYFAPQNPSLPCDESQICQWSIAQSVSNQGLYVYSNTGATMPGQMIERATGEPATSTPTCGSWPRSTTSASSTRRAASSPPWSMLPASSPGRSRSATIRRCSRRRGSRRC